MIVADLQLDTPVLTDALTTAMDLALAVDRVSATADGEIRVQCRAFAAVADARDTTAADVFDAFDAAVHEDDTAAAATVLDASATVRRYRLSLSADGGRLSTYFVWVAHDAILLDGTVTHEGWHLRLAFPSREALSAFREGCNERGLSMRLDGLYARDPTDDGTQYGLTGPQQDILLEAIDLGYFDIPRSASLAELGESLGITGQAASERLRRALKSLLENSLHDQHTDDPPTPSSPEGLL